MSYVYVGTRFVVSRDGNFSEVFVGKTENIVFNKMLPFVKDSVRDFITDADVEDVVNMTYIGEVEKDEEYLHKVELVAGLTANEVLDSLSNKDIVTIYANLYDDEESIVVMGYDEEGEEETSVLTNEHI